MPTAVAEVKLETCTSCRPAASLLWGATEQEFGVPGLRCCVIALIL